MYNAGSMPASKTERITPQMCDLELATAALMQTGDQLFVLLL